MYRVFALCFLVSFCSAKIINIRGHANDTDTKEWHLAQSRRATSDIQNNLNTLMVENVVYFTNTQALLGIMQGAARNFVEDLLVKELNKTRAATNAANAERRDAEYCYIDAVKGLEKIRTTTVDELRKCTRESLERFAGGFDFSDQLFKAGHAAIDKLEAVQFSCMFQVLNEVKCIASETGIAMLHVHSFNVRYKRRRHHRRKAYRAARFHALLCFGEKVGKAKEKTAESVFYTNSCIVGAE